MIRFSCPGCGAVFSVSDDKAGKTGNCPKCQTKFQIPAGEAPAPAPSPPPPPSNPFADLGDDDAPKKKKAPSKADLDDDLPKKKKPSSKADLDDEDDRPKKKPARRDDDEDDAPPPKKKPVRAAVDDDEDDAPPPKKKPARRDDDEDDYDDRPKKKPTRAAADDEDDYDDRPRKKSKGRRDDDYDDEDDYDDRPRRKPKKSGLLLTAAILHIIAAALYVPCGIGSLFVGGLFGLGGSALGTSGKVGGSTVKAGGKGGFNDREFEDAMKAFDTLEKAGGEVKAVGTVIQILGALSLLGGIIAIPAAVAGFTKKRWFVGVTMAAAGLFLLLAIIRLVTSFMYILMSLALGDILTMLLLPIAYAVIVLMAATNKNVKRVLT